MTVFPARGSKKLSMTVPGSKNGHSSWCIPEVKAARETLGLL